MAKRTRELDVEIDELTNSIKDIATLDVSCVRRSSACSRSMPGR